MKNTAKNFTMVSNTILQMTQMSGDLKIVYCILKSFNPSFPSNEKLMLLTGYGRNKIVRIKKELKALKLIDWKRRRNSSNLYEVARIELGKLIVSPPNSQEFHHDTSNNTKIKLTAGEIQLRTKSDSFTTKQSNYVAVPECFTSVISDTDDGNYSAECDYFESIKLAPIKVEKEC